MIEGLPAPEPRSNIDQMIEALANRQYGSEQPPSTPNQHQASSLLRHVTSPRSGIYYRYYMYYRTRYMCTLSNASEVVNWSVKPILKPRADSGISLRMFFLFRVRVAHSV